MATQKCKACNGYKQIVALGNITKDCPDCDGIGYIKILVTESECTQKIGENVNIVKVKKRGRPKRNVETRTNS